MRTQEDNFDIGDLVGIDLNGKTMGIVGTGGIGLKVIRIAKGFGMKVLALARSRDVYLANYLGFDYVDSLEEILVNSDVVSFHVPLTKETYHMLNKENISLLKEDAIVINTARGEVIETEALYKALKDKKIFGAGLDVIEGEQYIAEDIELVNNKECNGILHQVFMDKALFKLENVVFTPHNAFNSVEARTKIMQITIENIINFQLGKSFNAVKI